MSHHWSLRSTLWMPLILLGLFTACGDKEGDDKAGGDGGSEDGGATGDGGATSDGGSSDGGSSDGGSEEAHSGPCLPYTGFGDKGAWREYRYTAATTKSTGSSGTVEIEVDQVGADGSLQVPRDTDATDSVGGQTISSVTELWKCDESGSWPASGFGDGCYSSSTLSWSWVQDSTDIDQALGVVAEVEAESSWTDDWAQVGDSWSSNADSVDINLQGSTTTMVGGVETVTVPAGTFTARGFDSTTTIDGRMTTSCWSANRQLGLVKSDALALVSWSE